jgi:hypothetical protein
MVRCNRCGNENPPEAFVCAFCSAKLKFEKIERIKYFERPEKKWKRPQGILRRYLQVFTNPSELFWDLRYDTKRRGAGYIFLINATLVGLLGMVLLSKVAFAHNVLADFWYMLDTFVVFFAFGLLYHLVVFGILSLLYRVVASRGGGKVKKHSFAVMTYAFFPTIVGNAVNLLILLIILPTVPFSGSNIYGSLTPLFRGQPAWQVTGIVTFIIYAGWVPLLAGLCIRSLHEISTSRSFFWCYIIGILSGLILFLTTGAFIPSAVP